MLHRIVVGPLTMHHGEDGEGGGEEEGITVENMTIQQ